MRPLLGVTVAGPVQDHRACVDRFINRLVRRGLRASRCCIHSRIFDYKDLVLRETVGCVYLRQHFRLVRMDIAVIPCRSQSVICSKRYPVSPRVEYWIGFIRENLVDNCLCIGERPDWQAANLHRNRLSVGIKENKVIIAGQCENLDIRFQRLIRRDPVRRARLDVLVVIVSSPEEKDILRLELPRGLCVFQKVADCHRIRVPGRKLIVDLIEIDDRNRHLIGLFAMGLQALRFAGKIRRRQDDEIRSCGAAVKI